MKSKIAVLVFAVLFILSTIGAAYADSISGSGLGKGALGSVYCALAGCEMTGALSSDSAIVTENGGSNGGILISDSVTGSGVSNDTAANYGSDTIEASRKFEIKTGQNTVTSCIANGDGGAYWDACTVGGDCCSGLCTKDGNTKCAGNSNGYSLILLETTSSSVITLDSGGSTDELVVGNMATTLAGDLDVNSVLYVDDTTDMVGINDATPTADLDVLGTTRLELVASAPTCDADTDDGVMYYKKGSNGSGLCICMWDGAGTSAGDYTVKATITFGTFSDSDC